MSLVSLYSITATVTFTTNNFLLGFTVGSVVGAAVAEAEVGVTVAGVAVPTAVLLWPEATVNTTAERQH